MSLESVKYMLMVSDMERAVKFYTDVVGLEVSLNTPNWSELKFGSTIVALHGGAESKPKSTGLSLQFSDVRKVYQHAIEHGGKSIQAPEQPDDEPIILARLADPEGNEIMFTQYVG